MAYTTGLIRGGLVINKIFINSKKLVSNVEIDTNMINLYTEKYQNK